MDRITELLQERASLIKKQRDLIDKAEKENRSLTAEERTKFDRLNSDIDELEARINDLKAIQEREKKQILNEHNEKKDKPQDEEYRNAFFNYVRRGRGELTAEQRATLNTAIDAEGGYLVPTTFANTIIEKLRDSNYLWQAATIEQTSSEKKIPTSVSKPQFGWIDELGQYPVTDASFGQLTVDAYKVGGILKISEELLYDNTYNLEGRLSRDFTNAARDASEAAFVAGDGNKKPRGLILDAEVGVTSTNTDAVTFDEIIKLVHSLRPPYRRNARFLLNDNTSLALRLLKNNDGQYIWRASVEAGMPDRLLGYPVAYSENMPDMAASSKPIAFGDFSYYTIYIRRGIVMQRLNEKYADTGEVGFKTHMRVDGLLTLPEAVKVLQMAEMAE